jgi:Flp pilus assembly protein TadB
MASTDEILRKYSAKIESQISSGDQEFSQEYLKFKEDMLPEVSKYKRWAQSLGSIVKLKLSPKEETRIARYLEIAHADVTPSQALTLSVFSLLTVFFIVLLGSISFYLISGRIEIFFFLLGIILSLFVFYYTYSMPQRLANQWRLKASSQMVPAVLYVVVYMKHTSNLERAIAFAAEHLEAPLSLDFRKVFWDVEIGRFSTVKQSLDNYLETWRDYAPEFIESFHLIESSLFEPSEPRRIQTLEKALQVILDEVYEKMLKFSREIRAPLTNIYMLGIILPTLGLALLPLASTLLGGILEWQHVFIIFDILIPFFVFYMASEILFKRPGGHGQAAAAEKNPNYYKFTAKSPWIVSAMICLPLLIIGLVPFIMQFPTITNALGIQQDYTLQQLGLSFVGQAPIYLFDFKCSSGKMPPCNASEHLVGPFGPLGVLLSLCVPLAIGLFFALTYEMKTKDLIQSREETTALEREFTNSLFQLGNRLGDGIPAEIAFAKVSATTQGQRTQEFFSIVNQNLQQLGMSLEEAIFNKKRGALTFYPSMLIATSMKILVESVKKGLEVAARSLMSISEYVKNVQKIEDRLRDLLAEIVSDMKSNMVFLAPLLAGIVVGLSAMITSILNRLQSLTTTAGGDVAGIGSLGNILSLFDVTKMIPPYFIQIAVGIYIVEIIFILTSTLVTVDSGKDELKEKYELAKNLRRGLMLYLATALVSTLALLILGVVALGGIGS